jgi:uncharacterized membrane protein HdeD (DUF308 family)
MSVLFLCLILGWFALSAVVSFIAATQDRSALLWFWIAALFSPLVAAFLLWRNPVPNT